jgi:hypothetical protein
MTNTQQTRCPHCPDSPDLSDHIGGKPCTVSAPSGAQNLWDRPIFGAFWTADAREVENA